MISLLVLILSFNLFSHEMKIGTVDLQRAIDSVNQSKKAREKIEKEFGEKQKLLKAKEEEVKKMYEDFQKKALVISDKAKADMQAEIQKKYMEATQLANQFQEEYQKKIAEIRDPMIKSMTSIIETLAKEKKLDFVYANQTGILYARNPLDLTNDLIKKYNEIHK